MRFEFSELELPPIPNAVSGDRWDRFKRDLVTLLLGQRLEVFRDQASTEGPWAPLSRGQMALRLSKVPKKKRSRPNAVAILQDTGALRNSFTAPDGKPSGPGSESYIEEVGPDSVRIATCVEYAAIHNFGGTIDWPGTKNGFGRGITIPAHSITIPARPFDQFTHENRQDIQDATEHYLNG